MEVLFGGMSEAGPSGDPEPKVSRKAEEMTDRDKLLEIIRAFVGAWSEVLDNHFESEEDETYWHGGHRTWDDLREAAK